SGTGGPSQRADQLITKCRPAPTLRSMTTSDPSRPDTGDHPRLDPAVSRRGFLTTAAAAGGGLLAIGPAACAPASAQHWTFGPAAAAAAGSSPSSSAAPTPSAVVASPSMDHAAASPGPVASSAADHDANAAAVVKRFLGGEAATLPQ